MPEIKMPQLGESVVEGTITKWLKSEGDNVEEDELLVEISTDKVDSEVPSTESGTLTKILVQEGETVEVGQAIAVVGEDGEAAGEEGGEPEAEGAEAKGAEAKEAEQKEGEEEEEEARAEEPEEKKEEEEPEQEEGQAAEAEVEEAAEAAQKEDRGEAAAAGEKDEEKDEEQGEAAEAEAEAREKAAESGEGAGDTSKRGIISPLVRRLADEHGVDLSEVEGTGTGGRIRKQDVLKHVEERKAKPAAKPAASAEPAPAEERAEERRPAAAAGERDELVPWTNIRRRTAEHMAASAREVARAWNVTEVDWTDIVKVREAAKERFREREGFNLTYMAFLSKAVCETLLEMPMVNSTFDEEQEGNVHHHYVNLGIAVALEGGGLIVPVVKGAEEKSVTGLARAINDVVQRARSKKLSPDDLAGGTFTITNPGPFGSVISVPIIPRGQAAILAFEAIHKEVRVQDDDSIAVRSVGYLPMSWDHRAIDGAEAARFLAKLRERLETIDFSKELGSYL